MMLRAQSQLKNKTNLNKNRWKDWDGERSSDCFTDDADVKLQSVVRLKDRMDMEEIEDGVIAANTFEGIVYENDFCEENEDENQESWELIGGCSVEVDGVVDESLRPKRQSSCSYEDMQSFVQEDDLLYEIQQAGTFHGLNNYINKCLPAWDCKGINVAVTGSSGSGKSSLINALRGLKPNSPGAAKVGIKETTTEVQKYKFPENDKVVLWDMPGIGTRQFTRESYLSDFALSKFDIVVVVTANRFLENDMWIAMQALAIGRSVIFVRTKIDFDLMNASRDDPEEFNEVKCIETIKRDIDENLSKSGIGRMSEGVYFVSSPDRNKYEFTQLSEKLQSLMNTKSEGICRLLLQHLEKAIEAKRDAVKCKFTGKKVASAVFCFLPIPKLETALGPLTIRQIREICLKVFCLDDESLQKVASALNTPVRKLKSYHLKTFNTEQLNDVERFYSETEDCRYSPFRKMSKYIVPVVGSALSACKGPMIIQECLDKICNIMGDDEFHLVQLRLQRLERQLRLF